MNQINDELLDLLTERALGKLSSADEKRLDQLLDDAGLEDDDEIELAVAAAMNAFAAADGPPEDTPVPERLERSLRADADRFFGAVGDPDRSPKATVTDLEAARARRDAANEARAPSPGGTGRWGWAVAALLAVVVVISMRPNVGSGDIDPAALRATLLAEADTTVVEWTRSDIPAYNAVSGDVVWNDARQQGYLRLVGIPANDPAIAQYQLWIVDPDRDANPVDGGVFDVPPGSDEIIIPIDAKLAVSRPAAFAITREQPGGVVVSDGPLLIVAST